MISNILQYLYTILDKHRIGQSLQFYWTKDRSRHASSNQTFSPIVDFKQCTICTLVILYLWPM